MSRGFAGGLAEGLNQGMQMYAMNEGLKSRAKADERADAADARDQETHAAKQQEIQSVRKMTEGWAQILGWNPQHAAGAPMRTDAPGLGAPPAPPDTPSAAGLGGPPPMGTPSAAGLQAAAPAQQQQEPMSPGEYIQKQVWAGDAFSNPETLNKMAAVAFANNQGPMGIQFLNQVHTAKKQGWSDALGKLVSGDTAGATKVLKQNGMDIRGELTPVEGEEHTYEADIGGKKQKISAKNLFMSGNPEEAYKMHIQSQELARKTALEEKTHALNERKVANDERETTANIGYIKERGALARANARKADRMPAKSASSDKSIEQAITRWDKRADLLATVTGEDGTKEVDPEIRGAYDDARAHIQSILEDETGEEVDSRTHHKITDEILRNPTLVKGNPKEKAAAVAKVLRRLKLDVPEGEEAKDPAALPGKPAVATKAPPAAPLKKDPTREEREVESLSKHNDYPTLIHDLKRLQKERYAENLTAKEKDEVERKIRSMVDPSKPGLKTSRNRAPSSDPEVAPAYGKRQDGTDKGNGWLGVHKSTKGHDMTEYTVGLNINGKDIDVPTFVPGLTKEELAHLKTEPDMSKRNAINESILRKAAAHAKKRMADGKSVFAD